MDRLINDIKKSPVLIGIKARTKEQAIWEMLGYALEKGASFNINQTFAEVLRCEGAESTGLGYGVAFPHAEVDNVKDDPFLIFATSREGVDFGARDGKPVHVIMMFLNARGMYDTYLKDLSTFADLSHLVMHIVVLMLSDTEDEFRNHLITYIEERALFHRRVE